MVMGKTSKSLWFVDTVALIAAGWSLCILAGSVLKMLGY
jgi:hypothetical protein